MQKKKTKRSQKKTGKTGKNAAVKEMSDFEWENAVNRTGC